MAHHSCVNNNRQWVFAKKKQIKVVSMLRQENGYGAKFIQKCRNKNWSRASLNKLLTKIDRAGLYTQGEPKN